MLKAYAGGTVFGETYGDGPVRVIWLHGWARSAADFREAGRLLASSNVASVALDLPGFGSSPLPARAGGARYYGELLDAVFAEISGEPFVLVGHSFGGRVAICYAAQHPARVHALVLSGTPLLRSSGRRASWRFRLIRRLAHWNLLSETTLDRARERYGSADYRAASGLLREIFVATVNESYDEELRTWSGPTTLLWGEQDRDVPVAVAHQVRELLRGPVTLQSLAGVGHLSVTESATALADAVMAALS